jgi:uncharacterized protein with HEPN domain
MPRDARTYLYDIQSACQALREFTNNKSLDDYNTDKLLRSAVERQFEIIGEAINQLHSVDSKIAEAIPEYQKIIAFRNILIHGYASIQNDVVWGVLEGDLPKLEQHVTALLSTD